MKTINKPQVSFYKEDGNIFHLLGICTKALKAAGLKQEAKDLTNKVWHEESYSAAILIMKQYVEIDWSK